MLKKATGCKDDDWSGLLNQKLGLVPRSRVLGVETDDRSAYDSDSDREPGRSCSTQGPCNSHRSSHLGHSHDS